MSAAHETSKLRALREELLKREGEILAVARALVEIESPSGDLEGNRSVVSLLTSRLEELGDVAAVEHVSNSTYGTHLLARTFGRAHDDQPATLLLGHTDTVHPRGSLAARPWREEDGRVYGPGVFDMKANCALAVEVLRACKTLGITPPRPVVLLLTCDEEVGSFTGRELVEREAGRAAQVLVLEPPAPGGVIKTARKGTGMFTLTVEGRAAHAGLEPEKGASAVLEMARQIIGLHELNAPARGTTVNVGVVVGGTRSNVVPAEAQAEIDVRFSTMAEAHRLEEIIGNLRPRDERVRLRVAGGINRPPLERTPAVAHLYERARAVAAALEFELGETSVGGASDGNFAAAKCPAVLDGLGIDGGGAHAAHEHILRTDIARRAALVAGLVTSL